MDQLKDSTWLATASFRKSGFHLRSWFWQLMRHAIKSLHGSSFRFGGGEGVVVVCIGDICIFFMIAFVMSVVNHFLLENKRNLQRNSCCTATLWRIAGTGEDGSKKRRTCFRSRLFCPAVRRRPSYMLPVHDQSIKTEPQTNHIGRQKVITWVARRRKLELSK